MEKRFGYCNDCKNTDKCRQCYRGSHYESDYERYILEQEIMETGCDNIGF